MRRELNFDRELLYAGAMFHDIGLMPGHWSEDQRFEVDGADAARDFLRSHGVSEQDIYTVWTAIALHTTPGIPEHMHPVVALVTAGVEMDVLGLTYAEFPDAEREAVVDALPRRPGSRKTSSRRSTTGSNTGPGPRSATSRRMCWRTRIRISTGVASSHLNRALLLRARRRRHHAARA